MIGLAHVEHPSPAIGGGQWRGQMIRHGVDGRRGLRAIVLGALLLVGGCYYAPYGYPGYAGYGYYAPVYGYGGYGYGYGYGYPGYLGTNVFFGGFGGYPYGFGFGGFYGRFGYGYGGFYRGGYRGFYGGGYRGGFRGGGFHGGGRR